LPELVTANVYVTPAPGAATVAGDGVLVRVRAGLLVALTLAVAAGELTACPPALPVATALFATVPAFMSATVTV
jgi:hypothetical protein